MNLPKLRDKGESFGERSEAILKKLTDFIVDKILPALMKFHRDFSLPTMET